MKLIQNISSTLKTWIFKKKLLAFSGRFRWEPEACFYCPEMCRFSCPTAESLRTNAATPRGKMSLLHLAERGYSAEQVAGGAEQRLFFLEQCTGCGRCTEYCVYEVDVATNLRQERAKQFALLSIEENLLSTLSVLRGEVLICEPGRKPWWDARPHLLAELGSPSVIDAKLPLTDWGWGKLSAERMKEIGGALSKCSRIWTESAEAAWFFTKGIQDENKALKAEVRTVWQGLFGRAIGHEFEANTVFHESFHLARLLPRVGQSIPMYERGNIPFHNGWNTIDCGGEGFYQHAHPEAAAALRERCLHDLGKDGRKVMKIVCQSLSCVRHLKAGSEAEIVYWLDEMVGNG